LTRWPDALLYEYGPVSIPGHAHRLPVGSQRVAGRDKRCEICLKNDEAASAKSAVFISEHDSVRVRACVGINDAPTNGVFVNGEELLPGVERVLKHLDTVRIGVTDLTLQYPNLGIKKTKFASKGAGVPPRYLRLQEPFRELIEREGRIDALDCKEMDEFIAGRLGIAPDSARKVVSAAAAWAGCKQTGTHRYAELARHLLRTPAER
jgi:FHA domain